VADAGGCEREQSRNQCHADPGEDRAPVDRAFATSRRLESLARGYVAFYVSAANPVL